jgi:hypothetical protein
VLDAHGSCVALEFNYDATNQEPVARTPKQESFDLLRNSCIGHRPFTVALPEVLIASVGGPVE